MVMWIVFGAMSFTALYNYAGSIKLFESIMLSAPGGPWGVMIVIQIILFILGMFLDPLAIMMLTVPLFFPLAESLGFSPIWFGVLFVVNMEMAFITPPFGFNLFLLKGVAPPGVEMKDIYLSVGPFVMMQIIGLTLCMIFPGIILWIPNLMGK